MEKLIYALWRDPGVERAAFNAKLLTELPRLLDPLVHALRINIQDSHVESVSAPKFSSTSPAMEAFAQIWVDSAVDSRRRPVDKAIASLVPRYSAWLVSESAILRNEASAGSLGERMPGYNHIAVISIPPRLTWRGWQDRWQNHHTDVAVECQSNFEYLQNLIVRPVTYAAAPYAAIIEESFPEDAATSSEVFHGAAGDPGKFERNSKALRESTFSFVDEGGFDLLPTSQYDFKRLSL